MPAAITESSAWTTPLYKPIDGETVTADSVGELGEGLLQRSNFLSAAIGVGSSGAGFPTPITEVASVAAMKALTGMVDKTIVMFGNALWRFYFGLVGTDGFDIQVADDLSGIWVRFEIHDTPLLHGTPPTDPAIVTAVPMAAGRSYAASLGSQVAVGLSYSTRSSSGDEALYLLSSVYAPSSAINGMNIGPALRAGDMIDVTSSITHEIDGALSTMKYVVRLKLELFNASGGSLVERNFYGNHDYCPVVSGTTHYSALSGNLTYQLVSPTNYVVCKVSYSREFKAESSVDIAVVESTALKVSRP